MLKTDEIQECFQLCARLVVGATCKVEIDDFMSMISPTRWDWPDKKKILLHDDDDDEKRETKEKKNKETEECKLLDVRRASRIWQNQPGGA